MDMKRTMIIGAGDQFGSSLLKMIPNSFGIGHNADIPIDITDVNALSKIFHEMHPDIVINAAAYTNVDRCEIEKSKAYRINAKAIMDIVNLCRSENAKFIQISTDYVFHGDKGAYKEEDDPDPINYYDFTKSMGDAFALSY
jgi:dTDP-4-dehydrorhamnose reductase